MSRTFLLKFLPLYLGCFGVFTSTVFLCMVLLAALRFRYRAARYKPQIREANFPPVSLLKPLHGAEPGLREYLESFFRLDYPTFEMIFCARTDDDAGLLIARELAAQYQTIKTSFLISGVPPWPNARCYSMSLMAKSAMHDILVVTDSDVRVKPNFLKEILSPFVGHPEIGGTTCIYRGVAENLGLWGRLEGLGMSVEMTAGVIVAEMLEGMKFMLGPVMVVRKDAIQTIGGFDRLGDYYADDFMLGNLVSFTHTVTLSTHTIDHCIVNDSFWSNFKHQWNWAKSTRFSRPMGHFGTLLTYSTPFGLLSVLGVHIAGLPMAFGTALFAWACLSRILLCLIAGGMIVQAPDAFKFCWLYPLRDFLGFIFWAVSYTSRHVGWREDVFLLEKQGKMRKVMA